MTNGGWADALKWSLLGALGASLSSACGGTATTTGDGDGDVAGDGDGDIPGDGDGDVVGDGDGDGDLAACTNPTEIAPGLESCGEGYTHRTTPQSCDPFVPREEAIGNPEVCTPEVGCCVYDSDCTGERQYCSLSPDTWSYCATGCFTDADCVDGALCECGSPMGKCVAALCKADADCAGDARCAAWSIDYGCGAEVTYSCQTARDECATDSDCSKGSDCDGSSGIRRCVERMLVCEVGRPFLVAGEVRVAQVRARADWAEVDGFAATSQIDESSRSLMAALTAQERQELAEYFERSGQMEHASIAAFARFSLQLLALGAPAELVEQTNQAMADETAHARACFALASRYRETSVGPARLDMAGALRETSLEAVLDLVIAEGCVGETVAALEAAEAASRTQDAHTRSILEKIAGDEARHAELAWRFARWALSEKPELASRTEETFARLVRLPGDPTSSAAVSPEETSSADSAGKKARDLAAYGMLSERVRFDVRQDALRRIIAPCAAQLLSSAQLLFAARPTGGAPSLTAPAARA